MSLKSHENHLSYTNMPTDPMPALKIEFCSDSERLSNSTSLKYIEPVGT